MREQGLGTLISPVVERRKMAAKVDGKEEMSDGRRRLSTGGFSASFHGAKYINDNNGNGLFQSSNIRFKGGNTTSMQTLIQINSNGGKPQHQNSKDGAFPEHSVQKAASGEAEANVLKRKLSAEDVALPQWGRRKRSRYNNRFESSKHAVTLIPEGSASKPPSPAENNSVNPSSGSDPVPKLRSEAHPKQMAPKSALADSPMLRNGVLKAGSSSTTIHARTSDASRGETTEAQSAHLQRKLPTTDNGSSKQQQQQQQQKAMEVKDSAADNRGHVNGGSLKNKKMAAGATNDAVDKTKGGAYQSLEWPRFVLALTRKEKEEDFLIIKGSKLPQRPKKRPKAVEKTLIYCTPGNWLSDLARGRYDVREKKCSRKKPRGLKAMESMESDSE